MCGLICCIDREGLLFGRVLYRWNERVTQHFSFTSHSLKFPSTPRPPEEFEKTLKSLPKNLSLFSRYLSTNLQIKSWQA
ncbi:hypothetical protein L6452_21501 [Arctium lappa]|uniref:Uncharacterized protein n=1 Tax=Arctium lappa TaxID=4217 RepID=A0ACB9AX96_ARCLA|nr:hypothetical protein L6452_21501 [Arctium lappa]